MLQINFDMPERTNPGALLSKGARGGSLCLFHISGLSPAYSHTGHTSSEVFSSNPTSQRSCNHLCLLTLPGFTVFSPCKNKLIPLNYTEEYILTPEITANQVKPINNYTGSSQYWKRLFIPM